MEDDGFVYDPELHASRMAQHMTYLQEQDKKAAKK